MKNLRERFTSDLKYPITVFDDVVWEFSLDLYNAREDYEKLIKGVEEEYNGNEELFLQDFYRIKDNILKSIKENSNYQDFIGDAGKFFIKTLEEHNNEFLGIRKTDIYNEEFAGGYYLSIDLRKANLQALHYFNPYLFFKDGRKIEDPDEFYKEWVLQFTEGKKLLEWYIPKSKYLRQVIFGNCNPSRQISIERGLISRACKKLGEKENVVMFGSDEIIFKLPEKPTETFNPEKLQAEILRDSVIHVKVTPFKLESIAFKTGNNHIIRVYKRINTYNGEVEYKGIQKQYHAQIYEILHGIEPDPYNRDLMFYYEKEPAIFLNRLHEL